MSDIHYEQESSGEFELFRKRNKGKSLLILIDDYVVIDIETTGLSSKYDEIIEVAAIRYKDGRDVSRFHSLVKPVDEIPDFITALTGITNEMVRDAPPIVSIIPIFTEFLNDDILVGHNVSFDVNFIYDNCMNLDKPPFLNDYICTMRLSRRLFKDYKNHKLKTLVENFGIANNTIHRSESDCELTAKCYEHIKQYIKQNKIDISEWGMKKKGITSKDISTSKTEFDEEHLLFDKVCVFTGVLEKMPRKDAMQMVADLGGINGDSVTLKTNYLILGNNDYCTTIKDGKSTKQKKAEKLILEGQDLEIMPEDTFYDLIADCWEY